MCHAQQNPNPMKPINLLKGISRSFGFDEEFCMSSKSLLKLPLGPKDKSWIISRYSYQWCESRKVSETFKVTCDLHLNCTSPFISTKISQLTTKFSDWLIVSSSHFRDHQRNALWSRTYDEALPKNRTNRTSLSIWWNDNYTITIKL